GGATLMRLSPAVGAAPALGEDDDAPTLVQQPARQPRAAGTHPVAVDGEGVDEEGPHAALPPLVEEVVRARCHGRAVPETVRQPLDAARPRGLGERKPPPPQEITRPHHDSSDVHNTPLLRGLVYIRGLRGCWLM